MIIIKDDTKITSTFKVKGNNAWLWDGNGIKKNSPSGFYTWSYRVVFFFNLVCYWEYTSMAVCVAVQFSSQCIVQKLVVWRFPKHARKHAYPRDKLCGLRYISPQLSLHSQALPILAKETTAATKLAALDFASQLWRKLIFPKLWCKNYRFYTLNWDVKTSHNRGI